MANPDIGLIVCPCCDFAGAHVRQTAKGRAYIVCDDCSSQTFARGSVSDSSIRRRMTPTAPAVQPDPAPNNPPERQRKAPPKKATEDKAAPGTRETSIENGGFGNWLNL
jgi:hypothetical protein